MILSQIFVIEDRSFLVTIEEMETAGIMPKGLEDDIRMALEDLIEHEGTVPDKPDWPS